MADIRPGRFYYYIRNWSIKGLALDGRKDYGGNYPSGVLYPWEWDEANRNILWMKDLVQSRATQSAESLHKFLTDDTYKNAKWDINSPYKNGEDFRAHPWLGTIWDLTASNKTAQLLDDSERTPGELLSILTDFNIQSTLMFKSVQNVYTDLEKCSSDESKSLATVIGTAERGVAKVWEQMHAMVHTMYATRKQPKRQFSTMVKFSGRAEGQFGVVPVSKEFNRTTYQCNPAPTLKFIYLEDHKQRHQQLMLLREAQARRQRASEASEAQLLPESRNAHQVAEPEQAEENRGE